MAVKKLFILSMWQENTVYLKTETGHLKAQYNYGAVTSVGALTLTTDEEIFLPHGKDFPVLAKVQLLGGNKARLVELTV